MTQKEFFCHFRPFFSFYRLMILKTKFLKKWKKKIAWRYYPFTHVYYKCRSYDIWFLKYKVRQIGIFLSFLAIFCPSRIFCHFGLLTDLIFTVHFGLFFALLPLLITKKNKIKKKMETNPVDIIVSHMCVINDNHMFGSSDMVHDGRTEKVTYRGGRHT